MVPAEEREEHSARLILHQELRSREGSQARSGRILRAIGLGGQILSDLGIRRSLKPQFLPRASLDYLSPRARIAYFFDAVTTGPGELTT